MSANWLFERDISSRQGRLGVPEGIVCMLRSGTLRSSYRCMLMRAAFLASLWPAVASADSGNHVLSRLDELQVGEVSILGRFIAGGVWLGDEHASAVSNLSPFAAVAFELDYTLRSRWAVSTRWALGRLASSARYDDVSCSRVGDGRGCMVDMERAAWWSSLSGGVTRTIGIAPLVITLRGHGGLLLRRHADGRVIGRRLSLDAMTVRSTVISDITYHEWHISPLVVASVGFGYVVLPTWVIGAEVELQASGLLGAPSFFTAATVFTITRRLSLD